ncbi:MAG: AAA family ATPase, partial [Phascolarctobacterium sp.]|nr:AAA family ATPase [Phascolarctobacterium sp.]
SDYEHALEQLGSEYNLDVAAARNEELLEMDTKALQRLESKLTVKISDLGPINPAAIEEYQAVKERSEFLTKQYNDLCEAKDNLEAVISEINSGMTRKFKEAFNQINVYFADCYVKLFGGGTALLKLSNPDDILNSGIDIEVQPPGKRLQSLYLMSGGERALTVIALLFALLSFQPSPFCILDEIDAALDDANIMRFSNFLREYATNTQFIIITHRKGTMECADIMYGVTMEESGVSKLLSVKISEKE